MLKYMWTCCLFSPLLDTAVTLYFFVFFFFKQKTAYEVRISDWSSDVSSSDLVSAEKSDNGEWRIEPVELFRVWPPVNGVRQPLQPNITGSDTPGLQAENRLLREQVAELREERNAWREQAQRQIGRASCRERGGQYVEIWVVAVSLKKKK